MKHRTKALLAGVISGAAFAGLVGGLILWLPSYKQKKEMEAINEQNEILLNQALEMVEFDLTLLKSMRQAPETANYNKIACNTGDLLGSSGFDAKQ